MERISALVQILLLFSIFTINVEQVAASNTIYIRADGSIDPVTANITSADNATYIFTDNNYDGIVIERDNIIVDGAGFNLQGTGSGYGIYLSGRSNVTLRNIEINNFVIGVILVSSSDNNVSGNNITNNGDGVYLGSSSSNNTVSGNNITNNGRFGVWLYSSSNNVLRDNAMVDNAYNFYVTGNFVQNVDSSNTVDGKPIYYWVNMLDLIVPMDAGYVALVNCTNIIAENLDLMNNGQGILLIHTTNSTIALNNITNNGEGVYLESSSYNTVSGNNINSNRYDGVWLYLSSNYNTIYRNNITNNDYGVEIVGSSYNTVSGNNINSNTGVGITLGVATDNSFYHNNIIDNPIQVHILQAANIWDNGCEGNYWSDFAGSDSDGDGIGDTPYMIDGDNQDNYPLMNLYWNPGDIDHDLDVDIFDVVAVADAYGSTPSDPNWNCHGDIIEPHGIIDMFDIVLLAGSYGEEYSP